MAIDWSGLNNWQPGSDSIRIKTIDLHTAGEPLRVIVDGFPDVPGATVLERRRYARENLDHFRTALMFEPRGHADMYGCLIMPPVTTGADFAVLFMHNEGYSTMCGHGIIAVATLAVACGLVERSEKETRVTIDTPSGLVTAWVDHSAGDVGRVRFQNVPSFVQSLDRVVEVPGLGEVRYDLAFGGAYYAYVDADRLGLALSADSVRELIDKGMAIKRAVAVTDPLNHPFESDLNFLYGTIFAGHAHEVDSHSRNVCIFAEGEVDRSPTGTGVSGRLAIHHARGEIEAGQSIQIESIIGTRFGGKVIATEPFGPYSAIVPEVSGAASITGRHEFIIKPNDPLKDGFIIR